MTMTKKQIETALQGCVEELASQEHSRWSHWQTYLHSKGEKQEDGSLLLPANLVSRWERQARTEYAELSPQEQESDRDQVRKYLPILVKNLAKSAD